MFLLTFIKKIHYKHHDSSFSIFQRLIIDGIKNHLEAIAQTKIKTL